MGVRPAGKVSRTTTSLATTVRASFSTVIVKVASAPSVTLVGATVTLLMVSVGVCWPEVVCGAQGSTCCLAVCAAALPDQSSSTHR